MESEISIEEIVLAAGGRAALARELGISKAAVSQWRRIPVGRALDVERLTGISRHRLRPDIYGAGEVAA
jgi:DNA-binding transcriptional regulator YdaS (Cro superfamily)